MYSVNEFDSCSNLVFRKVVFPFTLKYEKEGAVVYSYIVGDCYLYMSGDLKINRNARYLGLFTPPHLIVSKLEKSTLIRTVHTHDDCPTDDRYSFTMKYCIYISKRYFILLSYEP